MTLWNFVKLYSNYVATRSNTEREVEQEEEKDSQKPPTNIFMHKLAAGTHRLLAGYCWLDVECMRRIGTWTAVVRC
jgi:hypothetical protein